ncbi:MAG TPA: formylglycine-generating enzyme family protein, partial [Planctomycetota bacterium]|nr:formylglycine-generating enzyme family protein [Planctomycetota bacterium]
PYPANWRESHRPPTDEQVERRAKYKKLHANLDDQDEAPLPLPEVVAFEPPAPEPPRPAPVQLDGWPLKPEDAARLQRETKLDTLALDLGSGVTMTLVPVPAGRFVMGDVAGFPDEFPETVAVIAQPFYIGQFEVTNEQYAQFDPAHDSAYMDGRGKDRFTRGYPVNEPRQPVIRVTWHQAMAFCDWLSRRTGQRVTLPTEAQWEWACRAGTATPWSFGAKANSVANFADASIAGWNWGRCEPDYSDGARFSVPGGQFKPNAWGLYDMHGNVAEWTLSSYRPYPYHPGDGRDDPRSGEPKVVRGGSWNDLLAFGRSASRWGYPPHQPVYNVGFRVVVTPERKVALQPAAR